MTVDHEGDYRITEQAATLVALSVSVATGRYGSNSRRKAPVLAVLARTGLHLLANCCARKSNGLYLQSVYSKVETGGKKITEIILSYCDASMANEES